MRYLSTRNEDVKIKDGGTDFFFPVPVNATQEEVKWKRACVPKPHVGNKGPNVE